MREVAVSAAHQHGGIEWIAPKNPVKLIPGMRQQLRLELRLARMERNRNARGLHSQYKSLPPILIAKTFASPARAKSHFNQQDLLYFMKKDHPSQ
jgi:hypothetical protein